MKKIIARLHLWLALPFGLIIAIVCITGAILSFETEITEAIHSERYYIHQKPTTKLPLDMLVNTFQSQTKGEVEISNILISRDPRRTYQINTPQRGVIYFVDPYTAEIVDIQDGRSSFFLTTMKIHRWLLDSMKPGSGSSIGKTLVGISVIAMVILLLSGLYLWWPKNKKMLKHRMKFTFGKSAFANMHSWHVSGGFYTILLILLMSLTGLTWSFGWYRTAFYKILGTEAPAGKHGGRNNAREDDFDSKVIINWQKMYDEVKKASPKYLQITIDKTSASVVTSNYGNIRASDKYIFDPTTAEIFKTKLYKDQPKADKIRGWIYSLHVGAWGGVFTKILSCLFSLFGAFLAISGYYFWIRKRMRKRR